MRAVDLIVKKKEGVRLDREEIRYLVSGFEKGTVPDYQMAAFLMAVCFQGMDREETLDLTISLLESGDRVNLDKIPGIKVDKHSTGGVGDTTTLVLVPLVAAAGVPVAKMSGRGLGHTGGTIDKFSSIPGFRTDLSTAEMMAAVRSRGVAVVEQTETLVPADKKMYSLRDVTGTVSSLPLIAGSIMSKKLAAGADALVLDVKAGDGAFLRREEDAFALAQAMVDIGEGAGMQTAALITRMDQPLGRAVGNALEMKEAILTLRGEGPLDLEELCLELGGSMLAMAGKASGTDQGKEMLKGILSEGLALKKFQELIVSQHGDGRVVDDPTLLPEAAKIVTLTSSRSGYVQGVKAGAVGQSAMLLGAGRKTREGPIDLAAGIVLKKKPGDPVSAGEELALLHVGKGEEGEGLKKALCLMERAFHIGPRQPALPGLILGKRGNFTPRNRQYPR